MTPPTVAPKGRDVLLQVDRISKTFGTGARAVRALRSVSLEIARGEILALVGNNGAGKSTLMSICAGLLAADEGSVSLEGDCTTAHGGTPSRHLGLAPQEEALYPTLTTRRNLHYFGRLAGLRGAELQHRIEEVASQLLIGDLLDRTARDLSGGQRRRLHTGLALMHRPEVLLLDEPTVGVDIDARRGLLDFVRRTADLGAAILYSTHQLHEVEELGARVVVIDQGCVLAEGEVDELVARHAVPLAELRFDAEAVGLPDEMATSIDSMASAPGGSTVVVRVADATTNVSSVVELLDDTSRSHLVGATIRRPTFEQAYVRIIEEGRSTSGGTGASLVGSPGVSP